MKDKRIYKSSLSREDVETYQTTSNGKVKNAIEQKSLENDFDSDALDGWSENKASIHDLKKIDRKFKVKTTSFIFPTVLVLMIVLAGGGVLSAVLPNPLLILSAADDCPHELAALFLDAFPA